MPTGPLVFITVKHNIQIIPLWERRENRQSGNIRRKREEGRITKSQKKINIIKKELFDVGEKGKRKALKASASLILRALLQTRACMC